MNRIYRIASIVYIVFTGASTLLLAQKERLPQTINSYQPAIVPVLTIDGKVLFFDRKWHPENVGAEKDEDDIWYSLRSYDSIWSYPIHLKQPDNTRFSDVLFAITPDMSHALVYGICDSLTNRKIDGYSMVELRNYSFRNPVPLIIDNYRNYSNSFYATLSPDSRTLILCYKGDSTRGEHDLYVSRFDGSKGIWSAPKNLGTVVNSSKSEGSPFIALDGKTLYYSSEKQGGSGGFDLYMTRRLDDTWLRWSEPVSMGAVLNSAKNDNGICLFPLGDTAIINSYDTTEKREGLYRVALPPELQPLPYIVLRGTIVADSAGKPVSIKDRVEFTAIYGSKRDPDRFYSLADNRNFFYAFPSGDEANVRAIVPGFDPVEFAVSTKDLTKSKYFDYELKLSRTLPRSQSIATVYFDFGSARVESEQMAKLTESLKSLDCMSCKITVRGYADSTGSDEFNEKLSEERARNVAQFVRKLIPLAEIEILWYGKRVLAEGEDALNRKVEVLIGK